MNFEGKKCFFHVDLDAFFASVEQLTHPEWRGKPVIVGGLPGDRRAVVSTASYEARKYGVHSAMPLSRAVELCPNGIYTRGNYKLYSEYSEKIMSIFGEFSPDVRQISIDEAFLDMTGTERLFGDAIECAKKLKAAVFERTGLTVSVGIATTNYIAKISSGLKKPDGLYAVPPGKEEEFMLSLPLEKVWGVGSKTLERLRSAGFNKTSDIRKHSQELLASVFGDATACFLYNVVRGIEPPGFLSEAKSHSAGIENTYEYDLVEWNQIERALLSLSEQLMFRLLNDNLTGKTVAIKIRYDDFTTVNAQNTSAQNVTSVDDLFARAVAIFRSKYQAGRAIRLLGITINNTTDADAEKQNELFDFGEKKRKTIEKTILKISQKNPGLKIHKARLLSNDTKALRERPKTNALALAFCLLALAAAFPSKAYCDDTKTIEASGSGPMVVGKDLPPETIPAGTKFLDWEVNDKSVEFIAQGYWDAKLKQTMTATFGWGNNFTLSFGTPIFTQQVDMTLWFTVNKHWYLEAAFADEFNKNTFAAGYMNGQGYFKEMRVANRKVVFPTSYSVDDVSRGIGGGENQAPGVSAKFGDPDGKWTLDAALRYDMLASRDKTYYGKNSVNDTNHLKSAFLTGRMFVLPSFEVTAAIQDVYVESYNGAYRDSCGRKYKKLSSSDFVVVPSRKMLALSPSAGAAKKNGALPAVAVTFADASSLATCFSQLGNFGTNAGGGHDFLGNVQKAFGLTDPASGLELCPNVASFSYCGKSGQIPIPDPTGDPPASIEQCGFFGNLDNKTVLFVQHPAGFSPFTVCFRYDLGINTIDELLLVHNQSGKADSRYAAIQADDDLALTSQNFFAEKRYYADVYDTLTDKRDYTEPVIRYPFCATSPGSYLGYTDTDDIVLRARNYTPVNRFDIGTDAINGTVIVYKNGVIDSGAKYNSETGEVSISSSVGTSDKIYIVWYEDSKTFDAGSLAAAAGFNYNFTDNLSGDASFATRWTLSPTTKYAEAKKSYFGYGTLATRVKYQDENWKLQNTIAGTVENKNTTGFYKLLGFNDSAAATSYNAQNAAKKLPDNFAPRINPRPSASSSSAIELESQKNCSMPTQKGSSDSQITGYKIPVEWTWTGNSNEWAAKTISIAGGALPSTSTFSFAIKLSKALSAEDIYLQLGVSDDENFEVEAMGSIPTWKISDSAAADVITSLNKNSLDWQIIKVALKDVDRVQCVKNKNARIIIVNSDGSASGGGAVYFGPYELATQGVYTVQDAAFTVTTAQTRTSNPGAARFNNTSNYAQEITWTSTETSAPTNSAITAYKYFDEIDHGDYNEINMFFNVEYSNSENLASEASENGLTLTLDTDSPSVLGVGKIAALAKISRRALEQFKGPGWKLLTIDKSENKIYINGAALSKEDSYLQINNSVVPSRAKIEFDTKSPDKWNKSGTFRVDEIYFSKTSSHFIAQDKNSVDWKKDGVLAESKNGFPIVSDVKLHAASQENVTFYTEKYRDTKGNVSADVSAGVTLAQIAISVNAARAADSSSIITNASHSVSTKAPLFKTISFSEEYNFDRDSKSTAKSNSLGLDFNSLGAPLVLKGSAKTDSSAWSLNTKAENSAALNLGKGDFRYALNLSTETGQKLLKNSGKILSTDNYFTTWAAATEKQFSFGDSSASKRKVGAKIENTIYLPWASLTPQINYATEENYSASTNYYYSDKNTFSMAFPFKLGKNALSVSWKKSSGGVEATARGGSYSDDVYQLAKTYEQRKHFFAAAPIYDLISWTLPKNIHRKTEGLKQSDNLQSEYYNSEYDISFNRPLYADKRDFFIPSNVSFAVARDIRAAETLSDTNQYKLKLGWAAFNIFGKYGSIPIASWFEQDEYLASFTATIKSPRSTPSDITQVYTSYLQANFYVTKDNVLKNGVEFSFQDLQNYTIKGTVAWKRPGKISAISALSKIIFKRLRDKEIPITRRDSINCSWRCASNMNSSKTKKTHSYEYIHSADFHFAKFFALTTEINLGVVCAFDEICTLTAAMSLGGKLNF